MTKYVCESQKLGSLCSKKYSGVKIVYVKIKCEYFRTFLTEILEILVQSRSASSIRIDANRVVNSNEMLN